MSNRGGTVSRQSYGARIRDQDDNVQRHYLQQPTRSEIKSFNSGKPLSYNVKEWKFLIRKCFGNNVPHGYPNEVFNTPDTPEILESKIISAMHVYKIINDYDSSKNQENEVISGIRGYFNMEYVKKFLSAIAHCPPYSCAFRMDSRSTGQCYCLFSPSTRG